MSLRFNKSVITNYHHVNVKTINYKSVREIDTCCRSFVTMQIKEKYTKSVKAYFLIKVRNNSTTTKLMSLYYNHLQYHAGKISSKMYRGDPF